MQVSEPDAIMGRVTVPRLFPVFLGDKPRLPIFAAVLWDLLIKKG
jgi:hypothetical protein